MKSFHLCAKPHQDIIDGKIAMEDYAANLADVYRNKNGSDEYSDPKTFFSRTFLTESFERIVKNVQGRLNGDRKKDSFLNIKTPFGGGKTHSMIGLLHKANEWNAKTVVLDGRELDPNRQTLWGEIEQQLNGKIDRLDGQVPHGATELKQVLEKHEPLLILIDEAMHYVDSAKAIKVEGETLANLTVNWFQELTTAVSGLNKVCVIFSLPSSSNEYANNDESIKLFSRLSKITGRIQKNIVPIKDSEIPNVVRRRLFTGTDEVILDKAEETITSFVEYCERENILAEGVTSTQYRKKLENSYPFLPQVIDVLYERWGTIENFQRTRGVLRLLSLVVQDLIKRLGDEAPALISLADFNLENEDINQELVDKIDSRYTGIIYKDITSEGSGSKRVDKEMGEYSSSRLCEMVATTMFMYSHTGATSAKDGATISEIKRSVCNEDIIPAQIDTVIQKAQDSLAFIHRQNDKFLFKVIGNITKLKNDHVENLKPREIDEERIQLIIENLKASDFDTYIFPENSKDVKDNTELKLVVLEKDQDKMNEIVHNHGESPRINRNTIFFVCPNDSDFLSFEKILKDKIAFQKLKDENIVDKENTDELKRHLEKCNGDLPMFLAKCYRSIWVPEKDGVIKNITAAVPSVGESISKHVYDELITSEKINESLGPKTLKRIFLTEDYVDVKQLYDTFLRTPGEMRIKNKSILVECISNGVSSGDFGFGKIIDGKPSYDKWKENCSVSIESGEILINPEKISPPSSKSSIEEDPVEKGFGEDEDGKGSAEGKIQRKNHLIINTNLPQSQSYNFSEIMPKIDKSFRNIQIHIECEDGEISEDKIEEIKRILKNMNAIFDVE